MPRMSNSVGPSWLTPMMAANASVPQNTSPIRWPETKRAPAGRPWAAESANNARKAGPGESTYSAPASAVMT